MLAMAAVAAAASVAHADAAATLAAATKYYAGLAHHTETVKETRTYLKVAKPSTSTGTIWAGGGAFDEDLTGPGGHFSEVSDGKKAWTVDHAKKAYLEHNRRPEELVESLLAGTDISGCCAVADAPSHARAILLTPKGGTVKEIEVVIDPHDSHVVSYIVRDAGGDSAEYVLGTPDTKTKPPAGAFDPAQLHGYHLVSD